MPQVRRLLSYDLTLARKKRKNAHTQKRKVLQTFSSLPLHEQLIAKMASVYNKEFTHAELLKHVEQHQKDHEDTPINLKRCVGELVSNDIFVLIDCPDWMNKSFKSSQGWLVKEGCGVM